MEETIVGIIKFGNKILPVYFSLDEPSFRYTDVKRIINDDFNAESFNVVYKTFVLDGVSRNELFLTESGLYDALAQGSDFTSRAWRSMIFDELVKMRKARGLNIVERFDEWDHRLDDYYYDDETRALMKSVTVEGGDVIQVPVNKEGSK